MRGYRVAVTADRLVPEQRLLFERLGAQVLHLPLVRLELTPESSTVATIERVVADPPKAAVFSTALGVRWLFAIADASGAGAALRAVLDRAYVIARGPKARGALAGTGVRVDWVAPDATGREVVAHVEALCRGGELFVQLDGASDSPVCALAASGAVCARPYTCLPAVEGPDVVAALDELDAITFTSPVAVAGLCNLAGDRMPAVLDRLHDRCVVGVGPVTGAALGAIGVPGVRWPADPRLGAMVRVTVEALAARTRHAGPISVRANAVVHDDDRVTSLSPSEARVLHALVDARGAVVGKRALGRLAGVDSDDPHATEVIVARLRRRLGDDAALVETVPRRGYRLAAVFAG